MQRISTVDELFVDGDRAGGIVGTICTAAWLNSLQEEMAGIIEGYGGVLDGAVINQAAGLLSKATAKIQPITASVAGNALTITLNPTILDFRSADLTSGEVNKILLSEPISLTISAGSTLGTVGGKAAKIAVLALNNAGALELAAVNYAGGLNLNGSTLISTTAEGGAGAADSASVVYSTTARASLPFQVVGFVEITEAVPGTWASAPTTVQGAGGSSLASIIPAGPFLSAGSGYLTFPGGLIFQWGTAACSGGTVAVTFPLAFPSALYAYGYHNNLSSTSGNTTCAAGGGLTGFTATSSVANMGGSWFAIGR